VTQEPTCTENGKKEFFCTVCEERVREEVLIATGHQAGEWVVTKPVTKEEDGLEEKYCLLCNELLDSKVIPNVTWYYMTVCSAGLRFRDISDLTENWDMFTPIDLSQDGVQTFDLAAGNLHVIGTVTVTVADGAVTVDYDMLKDINLRSEFMTLFSDFASVTTLDESQLTAYPFGEQISIANDLGGDTKVLLYIHNSVNYPSDISGLELLPHKTSAFKAYVEELKLNMD